MEFNRAVEGRFDRYRKTLRLHDDYRICPKAESLFSDSDFEPYTDSRAFSSSQLEHPLQIL